MQWTTRWRYARGLTSWAMQVAMIDRMSPVRAADEIHEDFVEPHEDDLPATLTVKKPRPGATRKTLNLVGAL